MTETDATLAKLPGPQQRPGKHGERAVLTDVSRGEGALVGRSPRRGRWSLRAILTRDLTTTVVMGSILAIGCFIRLWALNRYGLNSDEAVYAGQAASIARHPELSEFFPTFRAHPLLFQSLLSIGFFLGGFDLFGRVIAAAIGIATIFLTYRIGTLLYGKKTGWIAAGLLAVMPYHVVVTRQVLLDGPMVFCTTLALYLLVRFALTHRVAWLCAAGGAMGLSFLAKETSILLVGAIYAFLALSPEIRLRVRELIIPAASMFAVILIHPVSVTLAGKVETGGNYLAWQLFRRPNHGWMFYPSEVPRAMGLVVVVIAIFGLWWLRRERSWRERLLVSWIVVPVIFFQLWPVKGFQYLLPAAPVVAILAARTLARLIASRDREWRVRRFRIGAPKVGAVLLAVAVVTLLSQSWDRIQPSTAGTFLAGSGGVPAGRETGIWIDANVPEGARFLTIGPSMANIIQFYGHRKSYGLSVSPNPLRRNPSYEPVENPDLAIRNNEVQYLVWDAFSASRSPFFGEKLRRFSDRFNGRVVHAETVSVTTKAGKKAKKPLIVIYQVRPILNAPAGDEDD